MSETPDTERKRIVDLLAEANAGAYEAGRLLSAGRADRALAAAVGAGEHMRRAVERLAAYKAIATPPAPAPDPEAAGRFALWTRQALRNELREIDLSTEGIILNEALSNASKAEALGALERRRRAVESELAARRRERRAAS